MIDGFNVVMACVTTGLCTLWFGRSGFIGSVIGQIIYYAWLREIIFG